MKNKGKSTLYKFGKFYFDIEKQKLGQNDGTPLHLPPKAIEILRILIENGGEIVDKQDLMKTVWADTIVEESNLTQTIYLLRKALGENALGRNYIQTLPKRGYRFAGEISEILPNLSLAEFADKIAVLPFENRSKNEENDYLAEGLSENLIDSLSQISQLKVIARSSSFKYKNSQQTAKEIAAALGVKYLLDGRIAQRGGKTSIRAELVDAENEIQIWGKTIECRICDLQKIKSEIVETTLENLGFTLNAAQKNQIGKHLTVNDDAYQLYLNGLFLFRKGGVENAVKALEFYDQATALDPQFAFVYALKPAIYSFLTEGYMDKNEAFEKARDAAAKALEFGAKLPQAHIAAAVIKKWELDLAGAERDYLHVFELSPNNSSAHNNYALLLSARGEHLRALEEMEIASQLDPLLPYIFDINKAWILTNAGRFDDALSRLNRVAENYPDLKIVHGFIGAAFEGKGEYDKAVAANRRALDDEALSGYARADIGYNLFKLGKIPEARKLFNEIFSEAKNISPVKLAGILEIDGRRDEALKILEEGYANQDSEMHSLKSDARLKALHDEPRFQALAKKMGLMSQS